MQKDSQPGTKIRLARCRKGGTKPTKSSPDVPSCGGGESSTSASTVAAFNPGPNREAPQIVTISSTSSPSKEKQPKEKIQQIPIVPRRTKLQTAQSKLETAAEKLKRLLPEEFSGQDELKMEGFADLNAVAQRLGSIVETLMYDRDVEETRKPVVLNLIKSWVKKALPFIEQGLTAATVIGSLLIADFIECHTCSVRVDCFRCAFHCSGS